MNTPTTALLETVRAVSFDVQIGSADRLHVAEAVNRRTRERLVVLAGDLSAAVVELAQQVGIELQGG